MGGITHNVKPYGQIAQDQWVPTATCEIYDPAVGGFTATGSLLYPKTNHAAILMPTGQVMVLGGWSEMAADGTLTYYNDVETFDPDAGTWRVTDTLMNGPQSYGLDSPKLALQSDGGVFIAGKPVMGAAQQQVQGIAPSSGGKDVQAFAAKSTKGKNGEMMALALEPLSGSLLLSIFSQQAPAAFDISYATQNQGVERYLNSENTSNGLPETNPRLLWKKDVPSIAYRPAKIDVSFKMNYQLIQVERQKLKARLQLFNFMGDLGSPKDMEVVSNGSSEILFMASSTFSEGETVPGAKIRVIVDPEREIYPSQLPQEKTTFEIDPKWELSPPINVYVFPIQYVYWDKDASGNMVSGTSQLTGANWTDYVHRFKNYVKSMFPVSWDNPGEEIRVHVIPVNDLILSWNEDARVAGCLNFDSTATTIPDILLFAKNDDGSYKTNPDHSLVIQPRWSTMIDLITSRIQDNYGIPRSQYRSLNTYFVGVFPSVNGHTTVNGMALAQGATTANDPTHTGIFENTHFTAVHSGLDFWSVHELGHQLGAQHAPFGVSGKVDRDWPMLPGSPWVGPVADYGFGAIGVPGWDPINQTPFDKSTKDLLSYTTLPQWVSDFFSAMWYKHQQDPATPGPRPFAY